MATFLSTYAILVLSFLQNSNTSLSFRSTNSIKLSYHSVYVFIKERGRTRSPSNDCDSAVIVEATPPQHSRRVIDVALNFYEFRNEHPRVLILLHPFVYSICTLRFLCVCQWTVYSVEARWVALVKKPRPPSFSFSLSLFLDSALRYSAWRHFGWMRNYG